MAGIMAVDSSFNMPGGDDFEDVTELFVNAANDMEPGSVILPEGFTLMDAMSAFEIGEPRMDSGMILDEQRRPPFYPLAPLLPSEVCWILDRSIACEMEWHSGNTLSQSVYTLLYVHHLSDINPDFIPPEYSFSGDTLRPQELITTVLRAAVLGLLKCCDLTWRELSKGRVHDCEDWQGEKCEVSLLEGINVEHILHRLDVAWGWVHDSWLPRRDIDALCDRIMLRKILLQLFRLNLSEKLNDLRPLVATGREILRRIRASMLVAPVPNSPASLAFDPYITRRLHNFMPIRICDLPDQKHTWDTLENLFNGWEELSHRLDIRCLSSWEIGGSLHIWANRKLHVAFLRSLTQSAFFDKQTILGNLPTTWLVERFFYETLGIDYAAFLHITQSCAASAAVPSLRDVVEHRIIKLIVPHIRSYWYNPPRRRRYLMRSIVQWHSLFDALLNLTEELVPYDMQSSDIIASLPSVPTLWRLSATREVILSGFQQELYAPEERPIAYWYLARTIEAHLSCIDELLPCIGRDSPVADELAAQFKFLTALQYMSTAMCAITSSYLTSSWTRMSLNFLRRYKWAFSPEYDDLTPAEPLPDLFTFRHHIQQLLQDEDFSPSSSFRTARDILLELTESDKCEGWAGRWSSDRRQFFRTLAAASERLIAAPASVRDIPTFRINDLEWDPNIHPWFPVLVAR